MTDKALTQSTTKDIDEFVRHARDLAASPSTARLIFALDATASREPTWDLACQVQNEMFLAVKQIGGLAVQLVYYRGFDECRAGRWVQDAKGLISLMTRVRCQAGQTQIRRILRHALKQTSASRIHAVVFVGDCVEEDHDELAHLAGELGLRGVKLFLFQEGHNAHAARVFADLARISRGAHCHFDHSSPKELGDLLAAVAAYASGGHTALRQLSKTRVSAARQLERQLS